MALMSLSAVAQKTVEWEKYFDELYASNDENVEEKEEIFDVLSDLSEHPINLNTAQREDLERIPFLTEAQIEELQAYIYQYHGMQTLGELSMIESLDATRRALLPYFVYVTPIAESKSFPSLPTILQKGKHTLMFTAHIPFYQREGDRKAYLGYPYAHSFRYIFRYGDYVQAGLVGAQDAGEPFFAHGNNWGYDHYSFYLLLRRLGMLKTLVVGRYKVNFGQGLVINNSFGFGKLAMLSTLGRQPVGIHAHASRSSANYLQGVAATVAIAKHLDLTAFLSYRAIDATLTDNGSIKTILKTGYHRTERELLRKNSATQFVSGANLSWNYNGFHLGLTGVFSRFNRPLTPDTALYYHRYAPAGNGFGNIGVDYGYQHHRFSLAGETAIDSKGNLATTNNLSFQLSPSIALFSVQRYYAYQYQALLARSFADGGDVQNESGILLGTNWTVTRGLLVMAYTDFAYFSHPRYGVHQASQAWDNVLMATYKYHHWEFLARYRLKIRGKDNADKTGITNETMQRGRLSLGYTSHGWSLCTQLDVALSDYLKRSFGYMATESVTCNALSWLAFTVTAGYFHTDDFASRLYVYERGPLYSFSFSAYYGRGLHGSLFARTDLSRRLMLILRTSFTHYFDRDHISSGHQQINSSTMSSLDLQVRWQF